MAKLEINPERSTVLVAARSSMGPIAFETQALSGWIEIGLRDGAIDLDVGPSAALEVDLTRLRSGNDLYDAELRRRIDARRYPTCRLTLASAAPAGEGRYSLTGDVEMHGHTRTVAGELVVEDLDDDRMVLTGVKELDIRDFRIEAPGMLMMKIYPEVQVQVFLEARITSREPGAGA